MIVGFVFEYVATRINSIDILITPKFKPTIDIDMVCLYKD